MAFENQYGLNERQAGDDPESQIKRELGANERLIWAGRPRQGIRLRAADAFLIPFSLMWGRFAIFWEASAFDIGAPYFSKLWGIPFVRVGLYLIVGRFFVDARQRSKTLYGITNQRVLIISGLLQRSFKSLNIETLPEVSLTERKNGSGTITLGSAHPLQWWYGGFNWPGMQQHFTPTLEMLENARHVYETIRDT